MFCKNRNIEIENSPPRLHTGTEAVERAIQTLKNLIHQPRRRGRFNRECKSGVESDELHDTDRT